MARLTICTRVELANEFRVASAIVIISIIMMVLLVQFMIMLTIMYDHYYSL